MNDPKIMYTGKQFRYLRRLNKCSQIQLSEITGIAQYRISKFENGSNITTNTYTRLFEGLFEVKHPHHEL